MKEDVQYIDLISKYLDGEASKQEITLLENWVLEADKNKALFNKYKQTWILTNQKNTTNQLNVEEEWKKMSAMIFSADPKVMTLQEQSNKNRFLFLKIAAAALILVVAVFWLWKPSPTDGLQTRFADNRIEEFQLSDGSDISLNKSSSLTFPTQFDGNKRKVTLSGDAYFDIEHRPEQPFTIITQEITVEVLGTSFFINSKLELPIISVVVRSGKVSMKSNTDEIILVKGEKGVYYKATKKLEKITDDNVNMLAWKTKIFNFDNTVANVIASINEIYGSHISITNNALKDCIITVKFDNQSVESILKVIKATINIEYKKTKEGYEIYGGSCD